MPDMYFCLQVRRTILVLRLSQGYVSLWSSTRSLGRDHFHNVVTYSRRVHKGVAHSLAITCCELVPNHIRKAIAETSHSQNLTVAEAFVIAESSPT